MSDITVSKQWGASGQCFRIALPAFHPHRAHEHDYHELVQVSDGRGVQQSDGRRCDILPGQVWFLPAGSVHCAGSRPNHTVTLDVLYFSDDDAMVAESINPVAVEVVRHLKRSAGKGQYCLPLTKQTRRTISAMFGHLREEATGRQPGYAAAVSLWIQQLLLTVMRDENMSRHFRKMFKPASPVERIDRVLHYMHTHYSRPITVQRMASMACLSRSQFHEVFKARTGRTLVEYLHEIRLERACRMLRSGDAPIADVALSCGFENLSHFYHVFRKHTGSAPGQYRREGGVVS